jgi:hypothetical protein
LLCAPPSRGIGAEDSNQKRSSFAASEHQEAEKFREQAEAYKPRGQFTLGKTEFLGCNDFDTVLIAPHKFRAAHRATCDLFSSYLAYKDIAEFIPEFGSSAQWIEQA